jgi:hypothetical protein
MENKQIPDSYFDYILREKKAAMRLADYKESGIWNEDSAYDDVDLTDDEVIKFVDIYRSKFFPKKTNDFSSLRTNFVDGESYENEYKAIDNFILQFSSNVERFSIDITNQQIEYYDGGWQDINISQDVFFQDYLSQLTLNDTYDIDRIQVGSDSIMFIPSDDSYINRTIFMNNDYICEETAPL